MFTSSTMVQNIDPILLPVGLKMTSNEENVEFPNIRECVDKKLSAGSQQCMNKKPVTRLKRIPISKCVETSSAKNCLTVVNKEVGIVQESGTFMKPNLQFDHSSVSVQKTNNTQTLSLGIEVIEFNPTNEGINKFVFRCKLCGKEVGNIFDIDIHNIDQGHFKCMFKDCNKIKFPSQFELAAHLDVKHKTVHQVVPVNNESASQAANFLPQSLALASQSEPKQSSAVLPQNPRSPVPRSRYTNKSKQMERTVAASRTDQTSTTCEEIVLLDECEEMDCNVATFEEQTAIRPENNSQATSVIKSSHNMCTPEPNNTGKSLPRQGRGSRSRAVTQHSQNNVLVQPECREELNNVTSTTRKIVTLVADRPPRLPTVDLTHEMPRQSPRAFQNKIQTSPRRSGPAATSGNGFTCQICQKNMSTQNFLNLHMKTAHRSPNKPFRCSKCTTNYSTHEALIDHLKDFHNIAPDARAMCIPVVDLNKPGSQEHLMRLGIGHFIPMSNLSADSNGNYCIPLYIVRENGEAMTTDTLCTKEVLKLGPLKTLPF